MAYSCERKRFWPHRYAAQAAARIQGLTAYDCPFCTGWHLTSLTREESEAVRRAYEDRTRKRLKEEVQMGEPTITFRVLQANPSTSVEHTEKDDDGNVTGIERQVFEDVVLGVSKVDAGQEDGAGRLVSGQLTISVPEGTFKVGQVLEAELEDQGVPERSGPVTASEGSTLRQDDEEARRGRTADGELGPDPDKKKAAKK